MKDNNFNEFMNRLVDESHKSKVNESKIDERINEDIPLDYLVAEDQDALFDWVGVDNEDELRRRLKEDYQETLREIEMDVSLDEYLNQLYEDYVEVLGDMGKGDNVVSRDKLIAYLHPLLSESKVNEQLPEDDDEPTVEPEEPKDIPDEPAFPDDTKDDETPEITKEYVGRTEDTHYYLISKEEETGEQEDLQIVDQEGILKYSAKDNNLELENIAEFVIKAIQDVEIDEIERSIFMKYILPLLVEEEEPEEEEELEDEEEIPELGKRKEPKEFEEDEEPIESKKKVNEQDFPRVSFTSIAARKEKAKSRVLFIEKEEGQRISWIKIRYNIPGTHIMAELEDGKKVLYEEFWNYEKQALESPVKRDSFDDFEGFVNKLPGYKDRDVAALKSIKAFSREEVVAAEGVENESKNRLIEMIVTDGENNSFDVSLIDDETDDTVLDINGKEFRFGGEFASLWRDDEGGLSEEGLQELALDALANLEDEEYNELVSVGEEQKQADIESDKEGGVVGDKESGEGTTGYKGGGPFNRTEIRKGIRHEKESKGINMKNDKKVDEQQRLRTSKHFDSLEDIEVWIKKLRPEAVVDKPVISKEKGFAGDPEETARFDYTIETGSKHIAGHIYFRRIITEEGDWSLWTQAHMGGWSRGPSSSSEFQRTYPIRKNENNLKNKSKGINMKNKVNEGDVSKDVKALIKATTDALKDGDYVKAAELSGRLSQIQQAIPDGVEAPKEGDDKGEEAPPVESADEPVEEPIEEPVVEEGKVPDDKDSEETKIKKLTEKDKAEKEKKAKEDKAKKDKAEAEEKAKKAKAEKEKKAKAKKESKNLPESKDLKLLKRLLDV